MSSMSPYGDHGGRQVACVHRVVQEEQRRAHGDRAGAILATEGTHIRRYVVGGDGQRALGSEECWIVEDRQTRQVTPG